MGGPQNPAQPQQQPLQASQKPIGPEIITVPLFESWHNGSGDGRVASQPHTYNRIMRGFDARTPGELNFGTFITRIAMGLTLQENPVFAAEWRDTDGVAPVVFFVAGRRVMKLKDGAITQVGTNLLAAIATGAAMHDAGDGVPYLYTCYANNNNIERMALAQTVGAGSDQRDKLASINGYLYGSSIAGSSRWSQVQFVPPGANPFTSANWSAATTVGWPQTDITYIGSVRGAPCVVKPEGIFLYNRGLSLWENRMPAWEGMTHPDNGRGSFSLGAALVIPMGRGGAIIFDGFSIREFSPWGRDKTPDLDTTQQSFSVMAPANIGGALGIFGVTTVNRPPEGGQGSQTAHAPTYGTNYNSKLVKRGGSDDSGADVLGVRFFRTTDGGTNYTNYTTQVGDGSFATEATLDSQDTLANNNWFIIAHPRPFQGVSLRFPSTASMNANAATLTVQVWNGSSWTTITHFDFTSNINAATCGQNGNIIFTQDPVNDLVWTRTTIGSDTQNVYAARFTISAAFDTQVRIAEVSLLPWRPPVDSTNFPEDSMDRAGCFPHLMFGRSNQNGEGLWHDLGAIMTARTDVDEISCLLYAYVGGSYGNDGNKLIAIGKRAVFLYEGGYNDSWPFISPAGFAESSMFQPVKGKLVRLREIRAELENVEGVNTIWLLYRYDANERWSRLTLGLRGHAVNTEMTGELGGPDFQWGIGYTMSLDTVARRPKLVGLEGDFEVVPADIDRRPRRPVANPPRG